MSRYLALLASLSLFAVTQSSFAAEYQSNFSAIPDRVWIGPEYWANPMEDWAVAGGKVQCITGAGNRNVHLLSHQITKEGAGFQAEVTVSRIDTAKKATGSVGLRIGIQSEVDDYRARTIHGKSGYNLGIRTDGTLFAANIEKKLEIGKIANLTIKADVKPQGANFKITVTAIDSKGKELGSVTKNNIPAPGIYGNIAFVNNHEQAGKARFEFSHFAVYGPRIEENADHRWGPILWSMHTLSRGVLKLSAQMPPLSEKDSDSVTLQTKNGKKWIDLATSKIDADACTATFRIADWNATSDIDYRLVYATQDNSGNQLQDTYEGTIRKEPIDRDLVVAGFTGNTDSGFPNNEVAGNVAIENPDMLFFSGDQLYEGVGGYGIIRTPADRSILNYLRKWYLFGWAFGDIMRDRVTICLPDDHDVYQGNIWGNGGNAIAMKDHDTGGYAQPAQMVLAVHRTQCSHHPDLVDPEPIKQGITPIHTDMLYGRVSFAIVMDRMFKSGPKGKVNYWKGRADHVPDPKFDPKSIDLPGLTLLGERQLNFLKDWTRDFKGADAKCVLSQTIFVNLANYHGGNKMYLVADLDSNGWPQTPRNNAIKEFRKGYAFHFAGDQHLPSLIHYGVDDWNDSGFAFCVPSIAAGYPRSWIPDKEGKPVRNRVAGPNTGEYLDGLHNKVTVWAIGNPAEVNRKGVINTLHDKSSGYGIVRFRKDECKIDMECYRLQIDPNNLKPEDQFPGWPKTIDITENYGKQAAAYLPTLEFTGIKMPVVQVFDAATGEHIYSLRVCTNSFRPKVFKPGVYNVKVGNPDTGDMKTLKNLKASNGEYSLEVKF